MAEQTAIGWTDSTFNPWIGCTKVSPACDNCYAAVSTPVRSMKIEWGPRKPRHRTSASNWRQPRAWNLGHSKFYAEHGRRRRVFCASLADVFDKDAPPEWRAELFSLVRDTPHLDWLLLTKRIGNVECMTVDALGGSARDALHSMPRNVWLGITVANQEEAGRDIPKLLALPARVRFLSIEPMLGPIDLSHWLVGCDHGSRPGPGGVGGVTCMECGGDGNGCQRLGWVGDLRRRERTERSADPSGMGQVFAGPVRGRACAVLLQAVGWRDGDGRRLRTGRRRGQGMAVLSVRPNAELSGPEPRTEDAK